MAKAKYPAEEGHKVCNVCLKEFPLSEFYFKKQERFRYHDPKCHSCARAYTRKWYANNKQKSYEYHRKWNAKNRERSDFLMWRSHIRRKYGLSPEEYNRLIGDDPRCAICGTKDFGGRYGKPNIDHCHKSNKVRGALCINCNRTIERIENVPGWCEKATAYLNALSSAKS